MAQLSERSVADAQPRRSPYTRSDGGTGLHLLVHPTGTKSYIFRWRFNDGWTKLTIGRAGTKELSLDDARETAIAYKASAKKGRNPRLEIDAQKARVVLSCKDAWKVFDDKLLRGRKPSTSKEYDRIW